MEFFLESICKFKNYKEWRKPDTTFIRITEKIERSDYIRNKRHLIRLYPHHRETFEDIDNDSITYKDMMKIISSIEIDKQNIMEDINLRFLCPDDEFRSKI